MLCFGLGPGCVWLFGCFVIWVCLFDYCGGWLLALIVFDLGSIALTCGFGLGHGLVLLCLSMVGCLAYCGTLDVMFFLLVVGYDWFWL